MLLNFGTDSLIGFCRDLIDDPTGAPRPMFPTDNVIIKRFLNIAYLELHEAARKVGQGLALKIAYATSVAGTHDYSFPSDFVRLKDAQIDLDGGDLSTLSPSATRIRLLKPADFTTAWQAYQTEAITEISTVSIFDRKISILAPPDATAAGSNAIRWVYEASTTALSGDTDEPVISRNFHDVICLKAAIMLMATKNVGNQTLSALAFKREREFRLAASEELWGPDVQFAVAGLDDQDDAIQHQGFVNWGNN